MLKNRNIFLLVLFIFFFSCATTEEKALRDQERQFGDFVPVYVNGFTLNIPSDMYIITNDYYTKGNYELARSYDITTGRLHMLSISEMQEVASQRNILLSAWRPSYATTRVNIKAFSFICEKDYIIGPEVLGTDYATEIIDWILLETIAERVMKFFAPGGDGPIIKDIDVANIGGSFFLEFTEAFGGHIIDEKYYCVRQGDNMIVITFVFSRGDSSNLERQIIESIVFIDE